MKKIISAAFAICLSASFFAQAQTQIKWPDYKFETVLENPITSIKNQASSGTCWCFSTLAVVESDIIRINKISDPAKYPDLSRFFVVAHSYSDRAEKYVRLDGHLGFSAGSGSGDVFAVLDRYGIVPDSEMPGMNYGTQLPKQAEMDAVLAAYVGAVAKNPNRTLSTAWKRGFDAVVAEYLGKYPETFKIDGKTYSPKTYAQSLGVKGSDYISFTSYTHHPFYSPFVVEVCDNWRWDSSWNLPIDELMSVIDAALEAGCTIAWGADVSDPGFTRNGLAVLVDTQAAASSAGSDQEHWVGKDENAQKTIEAPKERVATQESRQIDFDNKTVTDDHGMQIYGIAKDQWGNKYYMVKNSWGETGAYKGLWYASEAFVKNQTLEIFVHKDGVSKSLKDKLGIK